MTIVKRLLHCTKDCIAGCQFLSVLNAGTTTLMIGD